MKVDPKPGGIKYQDWNIPEIGPEEVLIQVKAAGLCGTDIHIYDWVENIVKEYKPTLPLIMGHEFSGIIVDIGSQVKSLKVGDRVTAIPIIYCEKCYFCKDGKQNICDHRPLLGLGIHGVFAEYVVLRSTNVFRLDDDVSFELGALSELTCVGLHAIEKTKLIGGDKVAVVGAGPLGLMMTILTKHLGAARIFTTGLDVDLKRLEIAKKIGAIPINIENEDPRKKILELTEGLGVDVVFETAGTKAGVMQCLDIVRKGGKIGILGQGHELAEIQTAILSFREIELIGSRAYTPKEWMRVSATLLKIREDLNKIITHQLPLYQAEKGIQYMKSREGVKILLFP